MMVWRLEVEDVGCPVDDMGKVDVFTFLGSESERTVLWEGKQGDRVGISGRAGMLMAQGFGDPQRSAIDACDHMGVGVATPSPYRRLVVYWALTL